MPDAASRPRALLRSFAPADFMTLGNAACGTGAILFCLNYLEAGRHDPYLVGAFLLLPLALALDVTDGLVARGRRQSPFGADLDSLADVVSFGVAPAVLGFTLGLRGGWDAVILCIFVCCGVSRLARYNVTAATLSDAAGKVKYYEGTPIPTSLVIVGLLWIAWLLGHVAEHIWFGGFKVGPAWFHPLVLIYAVSGTLMVSASLRIPKP